MKKSTLLTMIMVILLIAAVTIHRCYSPSSGAHRSLAIITTLSHPALESVRQGFIDRLKADTGKDIEFIDYNAEGNMQQANLIARQIAQNQNMMGMLAIGTLAAQTIAKVEHKRPIVIAAVSDPNMVIPDRQTNNVCGLSDSIDADYQIDSILKLLPDIKSISLLYSPHEANSSSMVKNLSKAATKRALRVEMIGVHEPQQIMTASIDACQKSDAVLIPLDNQLVAAMPTVIKATKAMPCPVIASNESPIHQGATIAFGVDYKKSGEVAARIMRQLIDNERTAKDIGFIDPPSIALYINERVLKEKRININDDATLTVIRVEGGV